MGLNCIFNYLVLISGSSHFKQLFCLHSLYFQEFQPVQVDVINNLESEHGLSQPSQSMEIDEFELKLNSYGTVLFSLLILITFYIFNYLVIIIGPFHW